jgi:hypothetical protein
MYMALLSPRTKLIVAHWATLTLTLTYRVSQELRSLLQDLIPELILNQKLHNRHTWVQLGTVQELWVFKVL